MNRKLNSYFLTLLFFLSLLVWGSALISRNHFQTTTESISSSVSPITSAFNSTSGKMKAAALEGANSGLVGWWKFDDASGTTASDSSGTGNNGTLMKGPVWTSGTEAAIGTGALKFDGVDDYATVLQGSGTNLNLSSFSSFTVSGWVYSSTAKFGFVGTGAPYAKNGKGFNLTYGYPAANQWGIIIHDGGAGPAVLTGFGAPSAMSIGAGRWNHITLVLTSTAATLYQNGNLIGNVDISSQGISGLGDANLILGNYSALVMPLNGSLDDVRIYNRALSATEITEILNSRSGNTQNGGDSSQTATSTDTTSASGNTTTTTTNPPLHAGTRTDSDPLHLANSHTIFIDPQNMNCKDDYTIADARYPTTPWCTVSPVSNNYNLSPGDTIYIRGGEYNFFVRYNGVLTGGQLRIVKSGTPGNPITIAGYPGETVTLRAGSDKSDWPISVNQQSYIDFKSLNFVGNVDVSGGKLYVPLFMSLSNGSNINITNSSFVDIQGLDDIGYGKRFPLPANRADPYNADGGYDFRESWGRFIQIASVSNVVFSNNTMRCSPDHSSIPLRRFEADGFETERDPANKALDSNIRISNNKFYNCGHQDISIRSGVNMLIDNNFFRNYFHTAIGSDNCLRCTYSNNVIVDFGIVPSEGNFSAGIELGGPTEENLVFNNIIYFTSDRPNLIGDSLQFIARGAGTEYVGEFKNNKIYNNLIYRGPCNAIKLGDLANVNAVMGNKIYNNIFYGVMSNYHARCEPVGLYLHPFTFTGNTPTNPDLYGNEFKNNIITDISAPATPFVFQHAGGQMKSFNGIDFEKTFSNSSSNIFSAPTFRGLGSFDFHSLADSPQIGKGLCVPEVTKDIDGNPRPSAGCDIGPYQTNNGIAAANPQNPLVCGGSSNPCPQQNIVPATIPVVVPVVVPNTPVTPQNVVPVVVPNTPVTPNVVVPSATNNTNPFVPSNPAKTSTYPNSAANTNVQAKFTALKKITSNKQPILDNTLLSIPTTTIDITVPRVPSWIEVLKALFLEIVNRIKMGAMKTWQSFVKVGK